MDRQLDPLFMLRDLGYSRFKLITQNDHSQLTVDPFSASAAHKIPASPIPIVV